VLGLACRRGGMERKSRNSLKDASSLLFVSKLCRRSIECRTSDMFCCKFRSQVESYSNAMYFTFSNFVLVMLMHFNTEDFTLGHLKRIADINL